MTRRRWVTLSMALGFALLNIAMFWSTGRFWIGGSSFLPLVGIRGPKDAFLLAALVNVGVILGSFLAAKFSGEFRLRMPNRKLLLRSVLGGALVGVGVTLAPGTCTTAFVTGVPMLSVSSFLSLGGIVLGAYLAYAVIWRRRR